MKNIYKGLESMATSLIKGCLVISLFALSINTSVGQNIWLPAGGTVLNASYVVGGTVTSCPGGYAYAKAISGYQYQKYSNPYNFSGNANTTFPGNNIDEETDKWSFNPTTVGTYQTYFHKDYTNSGCSITSTSTATYTINVLNDVSFQASPTVCIGGNLDLTTVLNNYTTNVSITFGGAHVSGNIFNYSVPGSYPVTASVSWGTGPKVYNGTVTVLSPGTISSQPSNTTVCQNGTTSFTVGASGTSTLNYQWYESADNGSSYHSISDAGIYSGTHTPTMSLSNVPFAPYGSGTYLYFCTVYTGAPCNSSVNSNWAALSAVYGQVGIAATPTPTQVCQGNTTSFTGSMTPRNGTMNYAWEYSPDNSSWTPLPNNSTMNFTTFSFDNFGTLTISNATTFYNGYYFRLYGEDACGASSNNRTSSAKLTVYGNLTKFLEPNPTVTVCSGQSFSLSANATPQNGGINYIWQLNGANIDAAAVSAWASTYGTIVTGNGASTINFSNINSAFNGMTLRCVMYDACGGLTQAISNNSALTVNTPISISTQPASPSAICPLVAGSAVFTVVAAGTSPIYKWQVSTNGGSSWSDTADGTIYSGSSTATLTLAGTNVPTTMNGYQYRCQVSNGAPCSSSATTNGTAKLTVNTNVGISTGPVASTTKCPGTAFSLSVTASGTGPFSYQWKKGGAPISGATSSTYSIASVTAADAATYTVTLGGVCGPAVTSGNAVLTVNTNVGIATQPTATTTLCPGATYSLSVTASGTGPFTYQWNKGGSPISGATAASYSITGVVAADAATYTVVVSGPCGTPVTSSNAVLNVNQNVGIAVGPTASVPLCPGNALNLSVTASGTGPFSYQWKKGASPISGATSSSYSIASVTAADAATYTVVVSGACGPAVTSGNSVVTVSSTLTVTVQPSFPAVVCLNGNTSITADAVGTGVTYQWLENGTALTNTGIYTGQGTNTLTLTGVSSAYSGKVYSCKFNGTCSTTTSNTTTLSLTTAPTITLGPSGTVACAGSTASLSVTATGTSPTYQWQYSSTGTIGTYSDVSGATSSTFTLSGASLTTAKSGYYQAVVSNSCGNSTSTPATLTVNPTTSISVQPANGSVCPGGSKTISVTAGGTPTITYQWQFDPGTGTFANVPGQTSSSITITNASAANGGKYKVIVHSACGTDVTSSAAILTVNPTPAVPTVSDVSRCGDGVLGSTATSAAPTPSFNWYANFGDVTPVYTGSTYTIANLTATQAYYATTVSLGCESPQKQVNFNHINPTSVPMGVDPLLVCVAQGPYNLASDISASDALGGVFTWTANSTNYSGNNFDPSVGSGNYTVVYTPTVTEQTTPTCYTVTTRQINVISSSGNSGITFSGPEVVGANTVNSCVGNTPINLTNLVNLPGGTWSTVTGSGISNSGTATLFTPDQNSYTSTSPNVFQYSVTVNGCTGSSNLNIYVKNNTAPPTVSGLPAVICPGSNLTLAANVSIPGTYTYNWYAPGASTPFQTNIATIHYTVVHDTTLYVSSQNQPFGCNSTQTAVNIVTPFKAGVISVDKASLPMGGFVKFNFTGSGTGNSFSWVFGDGFNSNEQNPVHYFYDSGAYVPKLHIVSTLGCTEDLSFSTIHVTGVPYSVITGGIAPLPNPTDYSISFYPNPVDDKITVSSEHRLLSYRLMSMSGVSIQSSEWDGNNSQEIPAGNVIPGIYILDVISEKGHNYMKVVKR